MLRLQLLFRVHCTAHDGDEAYAEAVDYAELLAYVLRDGAS